MSTRFPRFELLFLVTFFLLIDESFWERVCEDDWFEFSSEATKPSPLLSTNVCDLAEAFREGTCSIYSERVSIVVVLSASAIAYSTYVSVFAARAVRPSRHNV